jgi:hypothetical protein
MCVVMSIKWDGSKEIVEVEFWIIGQIQETPLGLTLSMIVCRTVPNLSVFYEALNS